MISQEKAKLRRRDIQDLERKQPEDLGLDSRISNNVKAASFPESGMDDTVRYLERIVVKVKRTKDSTHSSTQIIDAINSGDETI